MNPTSCQMIRATRRSSATAPRHTVPATSEDGEPRELHASSVIELSSRESWLISSIESSERRNEERKARPRKLWRRRIPMRR
uniref:Uncharacterized protein n=1 Tax=Pristionchus pacificus TaxID=54126 RepID=A0A2A6BUN8_PRIPA|eukprot:PDM69615.1 hypothetical protein PRIPAC_44711 [Pristionchus pacificus]